VQLLRSSRNGRRNLDPDRRPLIVEVDADTVSGVYGARGADTAEAADPASGSRRAASA